VVLVVAVALVAVLLVVVPDVCGEDSDERGCLSINSSHL